MILAFGDPHADKTQLRVISMLNFLDDIISYCKEHKEISTVVDLGDTFHTSNSIRNECFIPIFMKFMELSKIVKIIVLAGNHDIQNKDNDCLVETFSSFSHFVKKCETINIDGYDYDFLSYTDRPQDIPNKSRVLFGHLEVEGFYYNPNKKVESCFIQEHFDQYSLVVSGHLHHEQHKGIFEFVGSPYPTNRGEGGKKNYFALIDKDSCELVEYKNGPDYITINAEQFNENIDYNNKIVTVQLSKKVENFVKLRDILTEKGALEIVPEFIREEIENTAGHKVDTSEGVVQSAAKYLQSVKASEIDNNKLLECFKEVLKRVKCQ